MCNLNSISTNSPSQHLNFDSAPLPTGVGKAPSTLKPWSTFNQPIESSQNRLSGSSRKWADAPMEVKQEVTRRAVDLAFERGLNLSETATLLATISIESGFNPDAAAGSSSASGLGQFIKATGASLGLDSSNRFSVDAQLEALIQHQTDNKRYAAKKMKADPTLKADELAYALHHDGPSLQYGGLQLARDKFLPIKARFEQWLENNLGRNRAAN